MTFYQTTNLTAFPKTTKLTASQRSAIRAGSQTFASRNNVDIDVSDATWSELQEIKKAARIAARDVLLEIREGMSDAVAESLEKAQSALIELADLVEQELDARTARNFRGPSSAVDLSKRPEFEACRASAVDGGPCAEAPEAYALENRQSMKAWAQARDHSYENVGAGAFLRALTIGARSDAEQRALAGGTDAAGGYTVPTTTSSDLIDMARSEMVLAQAGARIVPLTTDQTVIAKVLSPNYS
jgi:HK97 family phage major capsid protein